jgi:diketogulonate reductase-like aldo/keto reductase
VVLRWAVQRGTVPLPRSSTPSRVAENFGLFSWSLSEPQMASLDELDATPHSAGRIMKGDHLVPEGGDWHDVWDEAWLAEWLAGRPAAAL